MKCKAPVGYLFVITSVYPTSTTFFGHSDFIDESDEGDQFFDMLPVVLSPDGIFVSQADEAPDIKAPSQQYSIDKYREDFVQRLINLGFASVRDYEEVSFSMSQSQYQRVGTLTVSCSLSSRGTMALQCLGSTLSLSCRTTAEQLGIEIWPKRLLLFENNPFQLSMANHHFYTLMVPQCKPINTRQGEARQCSVDRLPLQQNVAEGMDLIQNDPT